MTVCYSLPRPRLRPAPPTPHPPLSLQSDTIPGQGFRSRVLSFPSPHDTRSPLQLSNTDRQPSNICIASFLFLTLSFLSPFPLGAGTMQRGSALCVRSVSFGFTAVPLLVGDDSLGHYALLHSADRSFLGVSWSDCRLRPRSQTRVSQHYA